MTIGPTLNTPSELWIRPVERRPSARRRLFCLPFAGGGTIAFRAFPRALPDDVEVCAVCPPGREDRRLERPYDRIEPLVAALAGAIRPWLDRPFLLYGHSMGALVGFELARTLRAAGTAPSRLVISARGAPDLPQRAPRLSTLPDGEFVTALVQRYNGIPKVVLDEPELLALFLPLLRADLAVLETYVHRPGTPLEHPISVIGGTRDPMISAADLAAWRPHTSAAFRHEMIAGDHFFIQQSQDRFLGLLNEELSA
jgi:surfactin synthase thioesterase subunit